MTSPHERILTFKPYFTNVPDIVYFYSVQKDRLQRVGIMPTPRVSTIDELVNALVDDFGCYGLLYPCGLCLILEGKTFSLYHNTNPIMTLDSTGCVKLYKKKITEIKCVRLLSLKNGVLEELLFEDVNGHLNTIFKKTRIWRFFMPLRDDLDNLASAQPLIQIREEVARCLNVAFEDSFDHIS